MSALAHRSLLLYGLILFVFKDCRGLFLRHTQTGKCIAASDELVYNDPNYAFPYYVKMTGNCLDEKAQFRYLDSELLHNIEKEGTLVSPDADYYNSRWAVYKGVAPGGRDYQQSADHHLKQTAAGSLSFYNKRNPVCAEPDSSNYYLLRKTSCGTAKQNFTFGSVTAFNAKMENVHCSPKQRMMMRSADYGKFNNSGTFDKNANVDTQCSAITNCLVKSRCDGKKSCELTIDNILLPSQYCSDTSKQIYTKYTCVDNENSNIITEANIGLEEIYKGYLKVKDGSTWRYVVNTKWDKNQEKMLCQYLGFKSTTNRGISRVIREGLDIATGDLIIYDTNANQTSYCVHLFPSAARGGESSPYAACKLCDTPILTASKKFSSQVFSGHGSSDYQKANFSKSGWCSSMPGSYLLLDLEKEYHLTHVVVMADKNQTKWSSSYSMQYSHSNTSVDSSGETQINGNDNGYQASNTKLEAVYNARYIKIKSTSPGSTDFCLRIELCGTVQTPAPVYDITVTPSVTWAKVTWKLKTSAADSSYITHLIIHVEGNENQTRVKRGNQFNITGLKQYTKYSVEIQTQDGSLQRSKKMSEAFTTLKGDGNSGRNEEKKSNGNVGIAVGASLGVILIVVLLILAVIFLRRRYKEKEKNSREKSQQTKTLEVSIDEVDEDFVANEEVASDLSNDEAANAEVVYTNEIGGVDETAHPPVPIQEFAHYVHELKAKKNSEFEKQYKDLPKNMKTSWEIAKKPFNKKKNRYGNIVTYDYCRVVLSGGENEDYINASYIDGINENSYIACQGPTILTLHDMWRMVWEQCSYSIVMVTSLVELNKCKCEKYWPDSGTEKYGDVEVTLMKIEEFADHVTHTLQLKKDGEEREVRHYYFQSWPDHGVPKYPTQLLAFRRHFRIHHLEHSGPIIVHCSAGVGRTGVFLAIDTILDKLEKGVINSIDVFGEVCAMRERRMNMVQTLEQYMFIHEAILENILCGMNEVDSTKVRKEIDSLSKVKPSGMTGFQEKFKRLGEVSPKLSPNECTAALLKSNAKKNRKKEIHPAESNRVPLQYVDGEENSDYINAVFVHGYLGRNYFIATQSPLPNTINDFWRLVHSQKSSTIVLLNAVKDGTSFPRFWPTTRGKSTQYERLTVQLESEKESDGISIRKFMLSPYPDLSDGEVVNIFHYTKWPDHHIPSNVDAVITLTSLVENSRKNYGQGPIIVVCSDGAGRTGTYIAISNLLERMKIEQAMDVFQSIKIIRARRPQFVENAEQYEFCYTAIMAYLDGFSDYSNFD